MTCEPCYLADRPAGIGWELTYACQLRCTHCYTESGRRASRKLPRAELLRIADIFVSMAVRSVALIGGEPLIVPEMPEIARRLRRAGIGVLVYTNGLALTKPGARELADMGCSFVVSLDGTTAPVNDAIRGPGAFDGAIGALAILDEVAAERRARGESRLRFGTAVILTRSNFHQLEDFCVSIAPRFPEMTGLRMSAVIPMGLASREGFAAHELLTTEQLDRLGDPGLEHRLRELAPESLEELHVEDDIVFQLYSAGARRRRKHRLDSYMEVEPDGGVRGIGTSEGVVGNIRFDSPEVIWQRCQERINDPVFVQQLAPVRTAEDWARAIRFLDQHFATAESLVRLRRRPEYVPDVSVGGAPPPDTPERLAPPE